ncbi:Gfo/Idh/MocA family oxidoreductase [Clavibacter tessellarius]|uniref:Gfo/Idh/MocA family oxidoreductase n=1 Tax=Clavibacter tessellarius TaxID=31965 RepID=UPI00324B3EF3
MGVSGSGKSTVGEILAQDAGVPFLDGDDLHPESNRRKMAEGHASTTTTAAPGSRRWAVRSPDVPRAGPSSRAARSSGTTATSSAPPRPTPSSCTSPATTTCSPSASAAARDTSCRRASSRRSCARSSRSATTSRASPSTSPTTPSPWPTRPCASCSRAGARRRPDASTTSPPRRRSPPPRCPRPTSRRSCGRRAPTRRRRGPMRRRPPSPTARPPPPCTSPSASPSSAAASSARTTRASSPSTPTSGSRPSSTSRTPPRRSLADVVVDELHAERPRVFARLGDLIREDAAELVVICTPSGLHIGLAEEALAAGLHVVIEKPLDVDLARGRRIAELAREAAGRGILSTVISQHRFNPSSVVVDRAVRSGRLGRLTSAVASAPQVAQPGLLRPGHWRGTWTSTAAARS